MKYLADLVFELRTRWEWFDDLVDFLWSGECYRVDIVACSGDESELADYCDWLREQGPWALKFIADDRVPSGTFLVFNSRGPGLFRRGNWVEMLEFERTGNPFDPRVVMEA